MHCIYLWSISNGSPGSSDGKEYACNVWDLSSIPGLGRTRESLLDSLEKGMPTHSSILAWKIPWTEGPGRLQSMDPQRVRDDWMTLSLSWSVLEHTTQLICSIIWKIHPFKLSKPIMQPIAHISLPWNFVLFKGAAVFYTTLPFLLVIHDSTRWKASGSEATNLQFNKIQI